jgi:hypothetical protein
VAKGLTIRGLKGLRGLRDTLGCSGQKLAPTHFNACRTISRLGLAASCSIMMMLT